MFVHLTSQSGHFLQQLSEITSCTSTATASPVAGSSCTETTTNTGGAPRPNSPNSQNSQPVLDDKQIRKLEQATVRLVNSLPDLKPKYHSTKKKVGKELQVIWSNSGAIRVTWNLAGGKFATFWV